MTNLNWNHEPATERERAIREGFLTLALSDGADGLIETILIANETRQAGLIAADLAGAEAYASTMLRAGLEEFRRRRLDTIVDLVERPISLGAWMDARAEDAEDPPSDDDAAEPEKPTPLRPGNAPVAPAPIYFPTTG